MKKNTIKNVIVITITFSIVFAVGFLGVQFYFSNFKKTSEKPPENHLVEKTDSKSTTIPQENTETRADKIIKTVYPILGQSNKLSQKEKANMDVWRNNIVELTKKNIDTLFVNGFTKEKKVCLTFDDGPDLVSTPKALNILKENNIKASFFFIGQSVKLYPNVVKETFKDGNLVLSHSYSHPEFTKLGEEDINKQLQMTENEIFKIVEKKPAIVRPPFGDVNQETIDILSKANYTTVLWSIDTLDWSQREKDNIVNNVVTNVRPGEIILMHTAGDKNTSMEALPEIIIKLKEMGYTFVTLDDLLKVNAYK